MTSKKQFGSRFLYAEDLLQGGEFRKATVEISEVHERGTLTAANKTRIDKLTIGFKGREKLLVLCKTNERVIHIVTGEVPGPGWIGKQITLGARIVDAFGSESLAVRVLPPVGTVLTVSLNKRLGREAVFKGG